MSFGSLTRTIWQRSHDSRQLTDMYPRLVLQSPVAAQRGQFSLRSTHSNPVSASIFVFFCFGGDSFFVPETDADDVVGVVAIVDVDDADSVPVAVFAAILSNVVVAEPVFKSPLVELTVLSTASVLEIVAVAVVVVVVVVVVDSAGSSF